MNSEDEDVIILSSQDSNSAVRHRPNSFQTTDVQLPCPFCIFICEEVSELQNHVEIHHTNEAIESKTTQLCCPICNTIFSDSSVLESHFIAEHEQSSAEDYVEVLHNQESNNLCCPVCSMTQFQSTEALAKHVNGHFEETIDEDEMLARSLEKEQEVLMKSQEQKEFKRLQSIHGFDQTKNLSRQRDANLLRSAERGNLSAVEYHEKRIMLNILEKNGIDDGSSVSHDITPHLRKLSCNPSIDSLWLSSAVDHYAVSLGDSGWGCGYRNLQMMLSSLFRQPQYLEKLANILPSSTVNDASRLSMPSINRLQLAIEDAWKLGFDLQGCEQLGGKLAGTCKWIGATEIAAFLGSCRIRYRLLDFHRPSSTDGKFHLALFDWVKEYFKKPNEFKFPLYFQHQGHSRTIVGFEEGKKSKARLLILDPSLSHNHMEFLMKNIDPSTQSWDSYPGFVKKIWVPMTQLKAKQYQIVCVGGGFIEDCLEYTESKVLRSTRIP